MMEKDPQNTKTGRGKTLLGLYRAATKLGAPALRALLTARARRGKEDPARIGERMGTPSRPRPAGSLIWVHAASVGEAQSALILIDRLARRTKDAHILVTTGTVTSATLMEKRLPANAFHQFYPLDRPAWVRAFLDHWRPSCALWMESELWPNMLREIRKRNIPAALVNARLSRRSARRWALAGDAAAQILATFSLCLAQSDEDAAALRSLGAGNVTATDNLKYGAAPLPCDAAELDRLRRAVKNRPLWLYASTHAGEEALACRVHKRLKKNLPNLLTILVPRHPERGGAVMDCCLDAILNARLRGESASLPAADDDIYIADTLGEMGLFYRLAPLACIGRSFSADGGGGHNPIEAAQLGCAVLHGPRVQNLEKIYAEMDAQGAALRVTDEEELTTALRRLLSHPAELRAQQDSGKDFAERRAGVVDRVMTRLEPLLPWADPPAQTRTGDRHAR